MKYLLFFIGLFALVNISYAAVFQNIEIDGVSYTRKKYDDKKVDVIKQARDGTFDLSKRDIIVLIQMIKRECSGKRLNPNGRLTWDWLLNKFEQGC